MINQKLISLDRAFHKLLQDFPFRNEFNVSECTEWGAEALDLIAAPRQYIEKITDGNADLNHPCPISITNYRGKLPNDIMWINQIKEETTQVVLRESTDTFHIGLQKQEEDIPDTNVSLTTGTFQVEDEDGNLSDMTFDSPLISAQRKLKDGLQTYLTYRINGCYIFTNFEEGSLLVSYAAFPIDCNSLPLYPDNAKYTLALSYYMAEKIAQRLYLQDKMSKEKFQYIQQQRDWYIGSATNAGLTPSIDQMESWKAMTLRLIPDINAHSGTFKYSADGESMYTQNSI